MIASDLMASVEVVRALSPASNTDDTARVAQIIDHSLYTGGFYAIQTGNLADAGADWTVLLEESDASDMSGANAVADADLLPAGTGQEAAASFNQGNDDVIRTLGYRGIKRYTRLTITPSGNAAQAVTAAVWVGMKRMRGTVTGS